MAANYVCTKGCLTINPLYNDEGAYKYRLCSRLLFTEANGSGTLVSGRFDSIFHFGCANRKCSEFI